MSKLKYDYDGMRKAIRSWIENPDRILPPWIDSFERAGSVNYISGNKHTGGISYTSGEFVTIRSLLVIGLRPEDFIVKQMTKEEAVMDFLRGKKHGDELMKGVVLDIDLGGIYIVIDDGAASYCLVMDHLSENYKVTGHAYHSLRLDLNPKYAHAL